MRIASNALTDEERARISLAPALPSVICSGVETGYTSLLLTAAQPVTIQLQSQIAAHKSS